MRLFLFCLALCLASGASPARTQSSAQDTAVGQVGFGRAVAAGESHVFVGAPQDINTPGRVYVYGRSENGEWQERTFLEARQGAVRDGFGSALDVADQTLVVGTPSANAVYLFCFGNAGWGQTARLTPTDSTQSFGTSLSLVDDRLFVGTGATISVENGDTTRIGAVHLFRRVDDGTWREARVLRSEQGREQAGFGAS